MEEIGSGSMEVSAMKYAGMPMGMWVLFALSALVVLVPFVYIWKILRDVLNAAPDYAQAVNIPHYGWMAVLFAVLSHLHCGADMLPSVSVPGGDQSAASVSEFPSPAPS